MITLNRTRRAYGASIIFPATSLEIIYVLEMDQEIGDIVTRLDGLLKREEEIAEDSIPEQDETSYYSKPASSQQAERGLRPKMVEKDEVAIDAASWGLQSRVGSRFHVQRLAATMRWFTDID